MIPTENEARAITMAPGSFKESPRDASLFDPYQQFLTNRHFDSLDGVRCLCCIAVIKEHTDFRTIAPRLVELGWLGVDMFFGISGFLIVTLLIRERARAGSIDLKKFYIRRALRIFPVYYLAIFLVLFLYVVISPWKPDGFRYYRETLLILLTYTSDFLGTKHGVFFQCWSLAMEEQFYQVWPAIERFVRGWRLWATLGLALLVNQFVNFGFCDGLITRIYGTREAITRPVFMITFTPILLGVVLAHALNTRRLYRLLYNVVGHQISPFALLACLAAFCELCPEDVSRGWTRLVIQVLLTLVLASLVVREDHYARPILTQPFIVRLGEISYGMYVYHTLVVVALIPICMRLGITKPYAHFILVSITTYLVSEVSYRMVEQPLLRLKARFGH